MAANRYPPTGELIDIGGYRAQAREAGKSLKDKPLIVLTGGEVWTKPGSQLGRPEAMKKGMLAQREAMAALSSKGKHRIIEGTSHTMQVDHPRCSGTGRARGRGGGAPVNVSAPNNHPARIPSIARNSSPLNSRLSSAATTSSICSGRLAPIKADVMTLCRSTHATAI